GGRAGGLLPARAMSGDADGERRARRAEIRRRQVRRRRATCAALLLAVAGIGIWAAATLASGGADDPGTGSVTTVDGTVSAPGTSATVTTATVTTTAPATTTAPD